MAGTPPTERGLQALKAHLSALGGAKFQFDEVLREQLSGEQIAELLSHGEVFTAAQARRVPGGRVNGCHDNTAAFVRRHPSWFEYFGLACHGGIWRIHSWAVYLDGPRITRLAETTVIMDRYFGIPLGGGGAAPSLAASAAAGHTPAVDHS